MSPETRSICFNAVGKKTQEQSYQKRTQLSAISSPLIVLVGFISSAVKASINRILLHVKVVSASILPRSKKIPHPIRESLISTRPPRPGR